MVNPGPLDLIAAKLKPGGEFRLGTDDPVYCRWAMMVMAAPPRHSNGWPRSPSDFLTRPGGWPETRYEAKARREGRISHHSATGALSTAGRVEPQQPAARPVLAVLEQIDRAVRALARPRGCARPSSHRSALRALSPSMSTRISASPDSAGISASPFHAGNRSPE